MTYVAGEAVVAELVAVHAEADVAAHRVAARLRTAAIAQHAHALAALVDVCIQPLTSHP